MGPIENKILQKIENEYNPILLDIENESSKHASDYGLESHFKIILVSEKFAEQKRIVRSREVHSLLKEEIKQIHALSLRLFSQIEWDALEDKTSLLSPKCAGNH